MSSDALPQAFKDIPPNSSKGEARASVAGTEEAQEAVLDASIPQTAAVKVGPAPDVSISYDGQPQFQSVSGTDMQYSVNTSDPVFQEGTTYYACKDGVWYTATNPNGPWSVSLSTPGDIDKLPPANPHYNTKYVYIYQTTPQVVYVGYTPAYMGTYIWGPTVIYGPVGTTVHGSDQLTIILTPGPGAFTFVITPGPAAGALGSLTVPAVSASALPGAAAGMAVLTGAAAPAGGDLAVTGTVTTTVMPMVTGAGASTRAIATGLICARRHTTGIATAPFIRDP